MPKRIKKSKTGKRRSKKRLSIKKEPVSPMKHGAERPRYHGKRHKKEKE